MGTDLASYLAELELASSPPTWPAGALRRAWDRCEDISTMIAVLRRGAVLRVFEIDSFRETSRDGVTHWLFRLRSAGRYHRIEVRSDAGGEAMRRCFPEFPDDWAIELAARLEQMSPLERLHADLVAGRAPRIDEATHACWAACEDPAQLLGLLRQLGHPEAAARLADALPPMPRESPVISPQWRRAAAAVILAEFPQVPS